MSSPASNKTKAFVEIFSKNSNLDDSGIFLSAFFSRTKLKLHNILLTLKLVRKVITNLDSLYFSGSSEELNLNFHIY